MMKILLAARELRGASLLKTAYYSLKFKGKILVGRNVRFVLKRNSKINIAKNGCLRIGLKFNSPAGTVLEINEDATLTIDGTVTITKGVQISIRPNATLAIGDYSFINENTKIVCDKKITIGRGCIISWNANIVDTDIHQVIEADNPRPRNKEVIINNNVWVGFNAIILKGVNIGEFAVIGAGAVVTKDVPPHTLSAGNPAQTIKTNITWKD